MNPDRDAEKPGEGGRRGRPQSHRGSGSSRHSERSKDASSLQRIPSRSENRDENTGEEHNTGTLFRGGSFGQTRRTDSFPRRAISSLTRIGRKSASRSSSSNQASSSVGRNDIIRRGAVGLPRPIRTGNEDFRDSDEPEDRLERDLAAFMKSRPNVADLSGDQWDMDALLRTRFETEQDLSSDEASRREFSDIDDKIEYMLDRSIAHFNQRSAGERIHFRTSAEYAENRDSTATSSSTVSTLQHGAQSTDMRRAGDPGHPSMANEGCPVRKETTSVTETLPVSRSNKTTTPQALTRDAAAKFAEKVAHQMKANDERSQNQVGGSVLSAFLGGGQSAGAKKADDLGNARLVRDDRLIRKEATAVKETTLPTENLRGNRRARPQALDRDTAAQLARTVAQKMGAIGETSQNQIIEQEPKDDRQGIADGSRKRSKLGFPENPLASSKLQTNAGSCRNARTLQESAGQNGGNEPVDTGKMLPRQRSVVAYAQSSRHQGGSSQNPGAELEAGRNVKGQIMYRNGKVRKRWVPRLISLEKVGRRGVLNIMAMTEGTSHAEHFERVDLSGASVLPVMLTRNRQEAFRFNVVIGRQVYEFSCTSDVARRHWIRAIHEHSVI